MMIEVVLLNRCEGRVIRKFWLDASQGVKTAAAVGYSFASPPVEDERDLISSARRGCKVTVAGQMEATSESSFVTGAGVGAWRLSERFKEWVVAPG